MPKKVNPFRYGRKPVKKPTTPWVLMREQQPTIGQRICISWINEAGQRRYSDVFRWGQVIRPSGDLWMDVPDVPKEFIPQQPPPPIEETVVSPVGIDSSCMPGVTCTCRRR